MDYFTAFELVKLSVFYLIALILKEITHGLIVKDDTLIKRYLSFIFLFFNMLITFRENLLLFNLSLLRFVVLYECFGLFGLFH